MSRIINTPFSFFFTILCFSFVFCSNTGRSFACKIGNNNDYETAMEKQSKAIELLNRRKYEESLTIFMHLLRQGHKYGKTYNDIKQSFLLIYLKRLSDLYPQAKASVQTYFLEQMKRLEHSGYDNTTMEHLPLLAQQFALESQLIENFEKVMTKFKQHELGHRWGILCYNALIKANREDLIIKYLDLIREAERQVTKIEAEYEGYPLNPSSNNMLGQIVLKNLEGYRNIFMNHGKPDSAYKITIQIKKLNAFLETLQKMN